MNKKERQYKIIKTIAIAPWAYTSEKLSEKLDVNLKSIYRDLSELKDHKYEILKDEKNQLYLQNSGWDNVTAIKDSTIRQVDILRFIASYKNGVNHSEILCRFTHHKEISEKTIERDLKDLESKNVIAVHDDLYCLKTNQLIPPLQLDADEQRVLMDGLGLQSQMTSRKDEAKSIIAKLKVSMDVPNDKRETIVVHGRRPVDNLRRNYICKRLEDYARNKRSIAILYRKGEEPANEIKVNPLGTIYYWVLDNWYLVAQDNLSLQIKTYLVDRILFIEDNDERFSYPEGFDLAEWFQYSWGIYRPGSPVKVIIRFHDYFSTIQRVKEEIKGRKTCMLREESNGLIMEDMVDGIEEIAVWLRSFGAGAEVIEPKKLRNAVSTDLEKMIEIYGRQG